VAAQEPGSSSSWRGGKHDSIGASQERLLALAWQQPLALASRRLRLATAARPGTMRAEQGRTALSSRPTKLPHQLQAPLDPQARAARVSGAVAACGHWQVAPERRHGACSCASAAQGTQGCPIQAVSLCVSDDLRCWAPWALAVLTRAAFLIRPFCQCWLVESHQTRPAPCA
jgi:hypothetical protein